MTAILCRYRCYIVLGIKNFSFFDAIRFRLHFARLLCVRRLDGLLLVDALSLSGDDLGREGPRTERVF